MRATNAAVLFLFTDRMCGMWLLGNHEHKNIAKQSVSVYVDKLGELRRRVSGVVGDNNNGEQVRLLCLLFVVLYSC